MTDSETAPRRRLPDVALPPVAGGDAVPLRRARHGAVLVLLDRAPDAAAADYLRALAEAEPAVAGWDGRVLVVGSGDAASGAGAAALAAPAPSLPALADPAGTVAAAAGVAAPAVVVADQWGEVWSAASAAGGWPAPREAEQWARFLSIRCAG